MRVFDAFRAITRRQLRINYRSPALCFEPFSGSSTAAMTLPILPVLRAAGPELFLVPGLAGQANLQWTVVPGAYAYVVYRATAEEGPYTVMVAGLIPTNFSDTPPSFPAFYRVAALEPNFGLSSESNTVIVTT